MIRGESVILLVLNLRVKIMARTAVLVSGSGGSSSTFHLWFEESPILLCRTCNFLGNLFGRPRSPPIQGYSRVSHATIPFQLLVYGSAGVRLSLPKLFSEAFPTTSCQKISPKSCVDRQLYWPAVVLTSSCIDEQLYWRAVVLTGSCVDRQLCWPAVVLNGRCIDEQLYWRAVALASSCIG